jgi:hypothetical protein
MANLINKGNVDDIRCSLTHGLNYDFDDEINQEIEGRNRSTVLKMLLRARELKAQGYSKWEKKH